MMRILHHVPKGSTADAAKSAAEPVSTSASLQVYGGERVVALLGLPPAPSARHEYSTKEVTLEVVADLGEAVDHIHTNGSGHTEVIVTSDAAGAGRWAGSARPGCACTCVRRR